MEEIPMSGVMGGVMGGRRKRTTSRIEAPALSRKGPVNRYSPRLLAPRRLSTRLEALGVEIVPARLIRDREAIFGTEFDGRVSNQVDNLGVRQIRIAPRSPWQNGHAERWVGTLRRELLDHLIVLGERYLLRLVRQHVAYYNEDRPHMSLGRDAPVARAVQPPSGGRIVALPRVGGLHRRYSRAA
jgi:transposase InsO family protein